jgi:tRNA(adenine34) deaminase
MHTPIATPQDLHFMQLALEQAHAAAQAGEVPVGAVVVREGQVIAEGRNSPVTSSDPTAHAEVNAMRAAAKALGNYRLDDCTLYVTLEPCAMCSGALLHARFKRVVFGATEPKTGAVASVVQLLDNPQLNHQTQWQGGVMAQECAQLLKTFFEQRRAEHHQQKTPLRDDALRSPEALWQVLSLPLAWSRFACEWPSLGGWRLHWLDNGNVDQSTMVWLHGLDSWSAAFKPQLASAGHHIAMDLLGFGLSDKPKKESAHSLALHVTVLTDFIRHAAPNTQTLWAPRSMMPLCEALQKSLPSLQIQMVNEPTMALDLKHAPYPDKGHLTGARALAALLKK